MSSTKIINVLKDDSFQEILDLFKAAPAEEVIFVLPKRSKAFQKEDHFTALQSEAKNLSKTVSFLCSNPEINEMARRYKFDVLLARSTAPRKTSPKSTNSINIVNQIEDFYAEPALDDSMISTSGLKVQEALADNKQDREDNTEVPVAVSAQRLDDIYVADRENFQSLKVSGGREKAEEVEIKKFTKYTPKKSLKPNGRLGWATFIVAGLIVMGSVVFITAGKAEVVIKPVGQTLDTKIDVFASDTVAAVDGSKSSIPGQIFNIQKTATEEFPATGSVDVAQKARGAISIYNETSSAHPLVATTRFESADGHIFHTLTSVVVPAAKSGPGKIEVQVIAAKSGSDYNVPAGNFTIPAFKERGDAEKYKKIYGKSSASMHSGTGGKASVATNADLASAKQSLTAKITATVQDELKAQINGLQVINDNQISIGEFNSESPAAGTATFKASLSGSIRTVGFKQSDLEELVVKKIGGGSQTVLPEKLSFSYENIKWDDLKKGLTFTAHVTGKSYAKLDSGQIISNLLGKKDSQIKAYLSGVSGIAEAKVSLSPFWVRSVPKDSDKVRLDLSY